MNGAAEVRGEELGVDSGGELTVGLRFLGAACGGAPGGVRG